MLQVAGGFDVADDEITRRVSPGDLVITADIPLAADVIARGALTGGPPVSGPSERQAFASQLDRWLVKHSK